MRLDTNGFRAYRLHQGFELERVFGIEAQEASGSDYRQVLGWRAAPSLRRALARRSFAPLRGARYRVQADAGCPGGFDSIGGRCYLLGYWQSEQYFSRFAASIRSDFTFRQPLSGRNAVLAERISACSAVSLHVRRGDYVSDPKNLGKHGVCSLDYYRDAIRAISRQVKDPAFFVFSDDMDWVRNNLDIGAACHFVDHNTGPESFNDMRLMSLCRHHVMANSSFSWWGAWLSPFEDKQVIAPKRWFVSRDDNPADGWATLI